MNAGQPINYGVFGMAVQLLYYRVLNLKFKIY